ncbi:hypothetical protein BKA63DRAFT_542365 [Paraphoma chrysanthemicola]|nr:hypothetical protein BKA63DRAFT_542365 [Paraphoma chrysanthemicola]
MTRKAYNRIAIYGHCGWVSSVIVRSLAASGAPVKVIYQPGADIDWLPSTVSTIEVDVEDRRALVLALQDIDIVISLVGPNDVNKQYAFIKAIPETDVKLFSPSHLTVRHEEQGLGISINRAKYSVERVTRESGIPITVILPGNCAEFALNSLTRSYIGAAYASIFARTPILHLRNRHIGLSELTPTGEEIAEALNLRHGTPPKIIRHNMTSVNTEIETCVEAGNPMALLWYCRKLWGIGRHLDMVGSDIWDVKDFPKASLHELVVEGRLSAYRDMPAQIVGLLRATLL